MGTKDDRNQVISRFVEDLLKQEGLDLFERWFARMEKLSPPGRKVTDFEVRDAMLEEILASVTTGSTLILNKKDKGLVEEKLNKFLRASDLLK